MVKLELRPGYGLGPFDLGLPLCEVLAYIRANDDLFPRVEIKYNEAEPLKHDMVINFPANGFHLRFESTSQRLRLIEVYDITRLQVQYAQSTIGGHGEGPTTFVRIYKLFGPTFPGCFDSSRSLYLLHYPGLLLFFPIPPPYASCCMNPHAEVPLEFPDGTTPCMSRISVYHGGDAARHGPAATSGVNAAPHMLRQVVMAVPPALKHGARYMELVQAELGVGLTFTGGGQRVCFGDTPQDVWAELGSPVGVTYKSVDTMLIHAAQGGEGGGALGEGDGTRADGQPACDYFYNYYDRGLDVLFDGQSHQVKKLVMHTNPVGHVNFNVYVKCNFMLSGRDADEAVCADESWADVQRVMGAAGRPAVHMSGAATNPFGPTFVYGYRNVVFEVMKSGNLASVILFKV